MRTLDFQEKILQICKHRDDDWSKKVYHRIISVHDLHAADAVYHHQCSVNFRTGKQIPVSKDLKTGTEKSKRGRPQDTEKTSAFQKVIRYVEENDNEQLTVNDLREKMKSFLDSESEPYSCRFLKAKLIEHFGENIIISGRQGKECVLTLRKTASSILHDFYYNPR